MQDFLSAHYCCTGTCSTAYTDKTQLPDVEEGRTQRCALTKRLLHPQPNITKGHASPPRYLPTAHVLYTCERARLLVPIRREIPKGRWVPSVCTAPPPPRPTSASVLYLTTDYQSSFPHTALSLGKHEKLSAPHHTVNTFSLRSSNFPIRERHPSPAAANLQG